VISASLSIRTRLGATTSRCTETFTTPPPPPLHSLTALFAIDHKIRNGTKYIHPEVSRT
jgi:hypothetical protein